MVEADRADGVEAAQVVLVGRVVAVPGDHVERGVIERRRPQIGRRTSPRSSNVAVAVLVAGDRGEEVARIGEPVGTDRTEIRQAQRRAEVLAYVAARRSVRQLDAEAQAARHHGDLERRDVEHAELGGQSQPSLLRHDEQLAVGVVEEALAASIGWRRTSGCRSRCADRASRCRPGWRARRRSRSAPGGWAAGSSAGGWARRRLVEAAAEVPGVDLAEAAVHRRRPDAVQPAAPVGVARRGEGGAGELLRIQPVGAALRGVAPLRQRSRQRLGGEVVAEAALVARLGECRFDGTVHGCGHLSRWAVIIMSQRAPCSGAGYAGRTC